MSDEFETYDADDVADDPGREEYRSLLKISPCNEANACETVEDCKEKVEAELERKNPRRWVVALFNERMVEIRNNN